VKTVRLDHRRAALLAVAAAGLLAAVGLFVVVLYAQPAEANFPGKPGKIAFVGHDGNDYEIYTINPNGGGKKQLTDYSTEDRYPSYSPSAKKIAYRGYDGNDNEIYTINAGGGGKKQLTDNGTSDGYPRYCQMLWIGPDHAASFSSLVSANSPLTNLAPALTKGTSR
jgi:hypothetical protein